MGKVLLIDDSPTIHKAVEIALKGQDHSIEWVKSVADLSVLDNESTYTAFLLDYNFPENDAFELLEKCQQKCPEAALILVCGTLDEPEVKKFQKIGDVRILRKPFDRRSLLEALDVAKKTTLPPPPPATKPKQQPPPPPSQFELGSALSVKSLDQNVYDELKQDTDGEAEPTGTVVLEDAVESKQPEEKYEFAELGKSSNDGEFVNLGDASQTLGGAIRDEDWEKIQTLVKTRLRDYCSEWVPQNLDKTMRGMIHEEMKHMNDEQWTKILTKALRDVVQEKFLNVAESVIRQELNQLLKEETQNSQRAARRP